MKKFIKNIVASIVVANFCALNLYMVFGICLAKDFKYVSLMYHFIHYWLAVLFLTPVGFIISSIETLIIGLPLYVLLEKLDKINLFTLICGGVAIATIPVLFCNELLWSLIREKDEAAVFLSLMICGGIGGFTFWLMDKRSNL